MSEPYSDNEQIKNKLYECAQACPELIPAIQNYWKLRTKFTMDEIIPVLKDFLSKEYNCFYMIQSRYILTPNPIRIFSFDEETYHLSIEYYAHPNSIYILLQNHIIWNHKLCSYNTSNQSEILLTPMDVDALDIKEKYDNYFETLKTEEKMIWLATEERDLTFDELIQVQSWQSEKIAFVDRNINRDLLYPIINSYMTNNRINEKNVGVSQEQNPDLEPQKTYK